MGVGHRLIAEAVVYARPNAALTWVSACYPSVSGKSSEHHSAGPPVKGLYANKGGERLAVLVPVSLAHEGSDKIGVRGVSFPLGHPFSNASFAARSASTRA